MIDVHNITAPSLGAQKAAKQVTIGGVDINPRLPIVVTDSDGSQNIACLSDLISMASQLRGAVRTLTAQMASAEALAVARMEKGDEALERLRKDNAALQGKAREYNAAVVDRDEARRKLAESEENLKYERGRVADLESRPPAADSDDTILLDKLSEERLASTGLREQVSILRQRLEATKDAHDAQVEARLNLAEDVRRVEDENAELARTVDEVNREWNEWMKKSIALEHQIQILTQQPSSSASSPAADYRDILSRLDRLENYHHRIQHIEETLGAISEVFSGKE